MSAQGATAALRRLQRLGRAATLALLAGTALGAAPDWLESCLKENFSPPADAGAVIVLESNQVRYLSAESALQTRRGAIQVATEPGRGMARISQNYDPDFQQMRSARAWIVSADRKRVRTYDRRDFIDTVAHYSRYVWGSPAGPDLRGGAQDRDGRLPGMGVRDFSTLTGPSPDRAGISKTRARFCTPPLRRFRAREET